MRPRINLSLQVAAGILALIAPCFLAAQGAPAVSLEEQLSAQYTLVKMGSDSSGPAVVEPGTILAIQKGGILGVPYGNMNMLPAKYQDGTLHPPATATSNSATSMGSKVCGFFGKCNSTKEQVGKQTTTRLFQVGEKVYPSKIEVHPDKDIVALSVIACDSCNNVNRRRITSLRLCSNLPKDIWRRPVRRRSKMSSPRSLLSTTAVATSRTAVAPRRAIRMPRADRLRRQQMNHPNSRKPFRWDRRWMKYRHRSDSLKKS